MRENENVKLMKACYAAFMGGDLDAMLGYFHEDVILINHGLSGLDQFSFLGRWQGQRGVLKYLEYINQSFEFVSYKPKDIRSLSDMVTAFVELESVHRATGARLTDVLAHVARISDGKIVEFHEHINADGIVLALKTASEDEQVEAAE